MLCILSIWYNRIRREVKTVYLVKCKCSSFFTIDDLFTVSQTVQCPNCKNSCHVDCDDSMKELIKNLTHAGMEYKYIPDNAKITVTFDI